MIRSPVACATGPAKVEVLVLVTAKLVRVVVPAERVEESVVAPPTEKVPENPPVVAEISPANVEPVMVAPLMARLASWLMRLVNATT